jgi:RNA 2',3'-cyclic 3'-phosphodiesterase
MRTFIALELDQEIQAHLQKIRDDLKPIDLDASWVAPCNLHMTLRFLGEIDDTTLLKVKEVIASCSRHLHSLEVNLTGFGFFPNDKRPRVFFIATDQEDALGKIALSLEACLAAIGFPKEGKFKNHITLARIKSAKNIQFLKKELLKIKAQGKFQVTGITLFKSVLGSSGPTYEVILKENFKS